MPNLDRLFNDGHDTPQDVARRGVQTTVHQLLRAQHGRDAVIERPISPRMSTPMPAPADWPQGIATARRVADSARTMMVEYARKARGDGYAWRDLAEPLGVDGGGSDPAVAAFELVAPEPYMPFDRRSTYWTCMSCEQHVTDCGPYEGHPTDNETGHADGCARHHRESMEYEADE